MPDFQTPSNAEFTPLSPRKCRVSRFVYPLTEEKSPFYECENRLAKYLEQLFLDTYKFHLNKAENCGEKNLYAVWDDDRHHHGTNIHEVANIYSERIGPGPYEI
jgi:hypothetical protein